MNLQKTLLLSVILFRSVFDAEAAMDYRISGNVLALVEEGEAVLTTSNGVLGGKIEVARAKIDDGKFSLTGSFDEIERANVAIVNAEGRGQGSVNIILEPAPIRISYHGKYAGLRAEGEGKYTGMLITSWQESEEYKRAIDEFEKTATKKDQIKDGPEKEAFEQEVLGTLLCDAQSSIKGN